MGKNYGIPYKGSKNSIAEWVLSNLPQADTLYDLFGGGGAITHAALESGKYDNVVYNEINQPIAQMFNNAVHGLYKDRTEWISREDFKALKQVDPFIATIWSFGNNLSAYMYSAEIEPWKKALHYAIVFEDYRYIHQFGIDFTLLGTDSHTRRLEARKIINENKEEFKKKYIEWYCKYILKSDYDTEMLRLDLKRKIKKNTEELQGYLIDAKNKAGVSNKDIDRVLGFVGMAGHYFGKSQWQFPTRENYNKLRESILPNLKPYEEVYGLQELLESLQSLQSLEILQSLERLERLQSLESLERLERLQSLGTNLTVYAKDYREVPITSNSVIYCDIPYKNTDAYVNQQFDYKAFYDWCCKQEVPVYISEYTLDDDRFELVAEKEKRVLYSADNRGKAVEKLFKVKGR